MIIKTEISTLTGSPGFRLWNFTGDDNIERWFLIGAFKCSNGSAAPNGAGTTKLQLSAFKKVGVDLIAGPSEVLGVACAAGAPGAVLYEQTNTGADSIMLDISKFLLADPRTPELYRFTIEPVSPDTGDALTIDFTLNNNGVQVPVVVPVIAGAAKFKTAPPPSSDDDAPPAVTKLFKLAWVPQ